MALATSIISSRRGIGVLFLEAGLDKPSSFSSAISAWPSAGPGGILRVWEVEGLLFCVGWLVGGPFGCVGLWLGSKRDGPRTVIERTSSFGRVEIKPYGTVKAGIASPSISFGERTVRNDVQIKPPRGAR
ncbi:hypothetical protein HK097_000708 [Rhizophlyctis rosea]|uniref:Uncharacterized protein n=1 Tax=Rhizophlyctis rosea TaxID=64517 RepID=A0AAD5S7K2_9FUNG|nr:hypothetical protein HK097_000708 [Rhizophlyctis rosea]